MEYAFGRIFYIFLIDFDIFISVVLLGHSCLPLLPSLPSITNRGGSSPKLKGGGQFAERVPKIQ